MIFLFIYLSSVPQWLVTSKSEFYLSLAHLSLKCRFSLPLQRWRQRSFGVFILTWETCNRSGSYKWKLIYKQLIVKQPLKPPNKFYTQINAMKLCFGVIYDKIPHQISCFEEVAIYLWNFCARGGRQGNRISVHE